VGNITIRRVVGQDKLLLRMQRRILPSDVPVTPSDRTVWWIAYDGDKPAGFASLTRDTDVQDGDFGHLSRSGVYKAYRGSGIQQRLIRARIAYARRSGWKVVVTDTQWWNAASINSLLSCGFRAFRPALPWMGDGTVYWRRNV